MTVPGSGAWIQVIQKDTFPSEGVVTCGLQAADVLMPVHSTTALANNRGEGSGLSQNLEFCFKQSALLILKANTQLL